MSPSFPAHVTAVICALRDGCTCARVGDRTAQCRDCGRPVWVSLRADEAVAELAHQILCRDCAAALGLGPGEEP